MKLCRFNTELSSTQPLCLPNQVNNIVKSIPSEIFNVVYNNQGKLEHKLRFSAHYYIASENFKLSLKILF